MKSHIYFFLLFGLLFSCSKTENSEKAADIPLYTIEQFMDVESINGSSFSPDESKILINSNKSGVFNAYEISIETGEITQVTSSEDNAIFGQSYFPEDDRIIYSSDQGGNELTQVFIREPDGSTLTLTPDSTAKSMFGGWSHDRQKFYLVSNKRDPRFFDMYQVNVDEIGEDNVSQSSIIYENVKGLDPSSISDDGRYIALVETITTNNSNMYLLDTESGETRLLSEHEGDVQYQPQYFSSDGSELIYLTDEDNEFMYLKSYNLKDGSTSVIQKADWDIWYSYLSHGGTYRVTAINEDARTKMEILNTKTGKLVELPDLPEGDLTSVNISESEKYMTFYASNSKSPNNLYLYNFETGELKKLTDTMNQEINPDNLVSGEVIRYKSFDGMEIPALLYKPKTASAENKVPALLWIHGGPGGQTRLNYSASLQYLVNHGYAVLAVNNRGSSGYGKSFFKADDRKHGQDDLQDCVESKKFLAQLDYINADKIGILGGSYGGYMVMAALAFAPEEFEVGVNYFGVTNWLRTLKSIPPWWTSFKEALYTEMGDPVADSVMLYNKSPLFHTENITKPFIVLQGSNDPRVLQVESDEIVEAARANGVPVEYVIFDDEGHGFLKKENNIEASQKVLEFLDTYLKGTGETTP
ncbi:S9 family peptidase [Fulvivirga sedimenti]|uniref:S9 family peptidase n=1 Tax=Fulvivirga sedimenti TaxID=2879465 RepID=A0A9X1KWE8_9BACT|nr:S9 family peptidase [Fulvivirga sedimenti]MCA6074705.1 S9 family peptidase [Fulvivirga sedimenti]MCA6075882.1 S9 family peptidase [Fulvivirga sedimenti]MCA6077010.1 S9 family peptidase [Fulvivirga sedimenti]